MGILFGTDGIRGMANTDLSPELAFRLGRASAFYLAKENNRPRIVIGKDTRISGDMLEGAFLSGVCSVGGDVLKVGIMPTPVVAFLTKKLCADAGVVISASHNPIEDNGIKLFSGEGYKLPDDVEEKIEELVLSSLDQLPRPVAEELGKAEEIRNAGDLFLEHIKKCFGTNLSGMKIVLDCAYGASYELAPRVFKELNAEVIPIHSEPDGLKINVNCGSTHPSSLKKYVLEHKADFGVAYDGDGDRCLAVDENGKLIDGDQLITIFGKYFLDKGLLKSKTVVATVMSNLGMEKALTSLGIKMIRTKVGDRYVLEEMKRVGANIGGEQSGHIILLDHNTTGDGIASSVLLSKIIREMKKPLSELVSIMKHMPQLLVNIRAEKKDLLGQDEEISNAISEMEDYLKDRGRLLVRASGTEPLIRVMAEGPDENELQEVVNKLTRVIEKRLGL